jgi:hypothetical protein
MPIIVALFEISSCSGYQNPGNNSGKTGDGTTRDSLKSKRNDTGSGANLRNKAIERANDSIKKLKTL